MATRTPGSSSKPAAGAKGSRQAAADPPPSLPPPPKPRKRVDWEAVERDFRTGKYTNVELARLHGLDPATLSRQIKKDQKADPARWQKDLTEVVRQATNARLMAELVNAEIKDGQEQVKETVNIVAEVNATVILGHRSDLARARQLAAGLMEELAQTAMLAEEQQLLAEIVAGGEDADPKKVAEARQALRKALDVGNRIGAVKSLAEALTKLHAGERKAHGLDDEIPPPPPGGTTNWAAVPPEDRQAAYLKYISGH